MSKSRRMVCAFPAIGLLEASVLGKSIISEIGHTKPRSSIRNQRMPKIPSRRAALARERVMHHERHIGRPRTSPATLRQFAIARGFTLNFCRSN